MGGRGGEEEKEGEEERKGDTGPRTHLRYALSPPFFRPQHASALEWRLGVADLRVYCFSGQSSFLLRHHSCGPSADAEI